MRFLDKLKKTLEIWSPTEEQINTEKGRNFEKFIAGIFSSQNNYFTIEDWTKDIYDKREGINVESNKNPDLIIKYKPTNKKFAIECKYRSGLMKSEKIDDYVVKWASTQQIERYSEFSRKNNMPIFVVIGLGGKPDNPESTFCIPLSEARYSEIYPSVLEKYERFPSNKTFFWKDGILK